MEPHQGSFSVADGVARIISIITVFLVPFFVLPLPYVAIAQSKVLLLSVLFILGILVWSFARLTEGMVHIPRSPLLYAVFLLPLAYLASSAVAGFSSVSLVGMGLEQDTLAAVILMTGLFVLTGLLFYGNAEGRRMLINALIAGVIALFALEIVYIFVPSMSLGGVLVDQFANLLGSWHDLGIMAGLALFLAYALMAGEFYAGWRRAVPFILGALAAFLVVVVHFSDIFFASGVLFVIAGLYALGRVAMQEFSVASFAKNALIPLVIGAALIAAGFYGTPLWDKLPQQIRFVQTEVRPSWQGTFDIARQSLQAPSEIVFGAGPNSFIREWGLHKPEGVNQTPFWNSDFNYGVGIIPTSIFTSGAVGLIAWAALILAFLALAIRFVLRHYPMSHAEFLGVVLLSVGYLVAYHMIYTPGSALAALTFVGLGFLATIAVNDTGARGVSIGVGGIGDGLKLVVFVALVLTGIGAAGLMGREVLSNVFVNHAAYAFQQNSDATSAGKYLGQALMISPKNDRAHRAAAELGIIELSQLLQKANAQDSAALEQMRTTLQTTIQHGLSAVSIDSTNYQNWLLLAQVYGELVGANIEGSYDQARDAYQKAAEANPTNPLPQFRLGQLYIAKGDRTAARAALQKAITLKPDFAAAYYFLSQVEAADGKGDAAVQAAAAAAQLVPQDPLGWFNLGYILFSGQAYPQAAQALAQAIQITPDYSNALFYLSLSLYQIGNREDAVIAMNRVAQLNPSEAWVSQMVSNMSAGKDPMAGIQQAQR